MSYYYWAWPALTDIHRQGFIPGGRSDHGKHGKKPRRRRGNLINHQSEVVVVQLSPGLAAVVERVCERWEPTLSGEAPRGDQNTILAASRRGVPCVLKIAGPEHNAIDGAIALEAWNGNGAARLLEADRDHGALLLERLDPDRTLRTVGLATAAETAGTLIHELAVPAPAGLPLLTDIASQKSGILRRRQARWANQYQAFPGP